MNSPKLIFLIFSLTLISGCGINVQKNQYIVSLQNKFMSCVDRSPVGRKAACALALYQDYGSINDSDYRKPALLNMAGKFYRTFSKVDKGQINNQDTKFELLQAVNVAKSEEQQAMRQSAAENRAAVLFRQQQFQNMQRLLEPPGAPRNCFSEVRGGVTYSNC